MIYTEDGEIKKEDREPAMRSCWECNASHDHLKKVNSLHYCFVCGRFWVFDKFISSFYPDGDKTKEGDKKLMEWLKSKGVEPGESTTKIDLGGGIIKATISFEESGKE